GVINKTGASFSMEGGNISGCTAKRGGGVTAISSSTFIMSGGFIVQNTAEANGGVLGTYTKTGGYVGGNTPQE
ncbi:MAG TPA: hypothetical protein O0X42_03200, partial [Methanocorpusculum sp.]|nr:hypothetical protein [Methanocorpusculum sp.]